MPKDKIDINLVFNYDLELKLDALPSKSYGKGDTVDISSHLFSNGTEVTESSLYQDMKAVLLATDKDTGQVQEIPLDNSGAEFKGAFEIKDNHEYELKVRAEESSFYRESDVLTINAKTGTVATTPPSAGTPAGEEPAEEKTSNTLYYIIGGIVLLLAAAAAFWLLRSKANRGSSDNWWWKWWTATPERKPIRSTRSSPPSAASSLFTSSCSLLPNLRRAKSWSLPREPMTGFCCAEAKGSRWNARGVLLIPRGAWR